MKYAFLAGIGFAAGLLAATAKADQIGFTILSGHESGNSGNSFLGYQFTTDTAIELTGLGIVDVLGNSLVENHYVGLFASNGTTLLASTTITAGSSASALNPIFNSVDPVILAAGTYDIGAYYSGGDNSDQMIDSGANFTAASGITWDQALDNVGTPFDDSYDTLSFHSSNQLAFFGPDFEFTDVPAPEPASLMLFGAALAGLAFFRRRRV